MPYKLKLEKLEESSKEKIESEIKYLSEENTELRRTIREGRDARKVLEKNEVRMKELMECYLGLKEEEK
ncbi:MAG TPA: hypothetical protein VK031_08130 [Tissierellaceae bacterium]|nr:hypothetical protein [Tissierellaceae bacterium]